MAIDGTKIIDSDLAHDVYNEFVDLYDAGVEVIEIRKKLDIWRSQALDDEEYEIFITVYALALWEIGELDDNTLREVRETIAKRSGYNMWLEESGLADAQARDKALNRFLTKISIPKKTARKRKPYKKVGKQVFDDDDVIMFQMPDGSYRLAIMAKTQVIHRKLVYYFAKTSFVGDEPPTEADIRSSCVFMHKIQTFYPEGQIKDDQPGIEKFWKREETSTNSFMMGMSFELIAHGDLIKFCQKLEVISKFKILEGFKLTGCFGYCLDFETLSHRFEDLDKEISIWKREVVALTDIEEVPNISFGRQLLSKLTGGQ